MVFPSQTFSLLLMPAGAGATFRPLRFSSRRRSAARVILPFLVGTAPHWEQKHRFVVLKWWHFAHRQSLLWSPQDSSSGRINSAISSKVYCIPIMPRAVHMSSIWMMKAFRRRASPLFTPPRFPSWRIDSRPFGR
jgi:hypothetical protein